MGAMDDIRKIQIAGLHDGIEYKTLKISRNALDQLEAEIKGIIQPTSIECFNECDRLFGMKIEPIEEADYCFILQD